MSEKLNKKLFTSESVTEGHPDKISDKISDAILDEMLRQDPMSRVACETFCTTGLVCVMGEVTTRADVDVQRIVRDTVREIGYDRAKYGFDCDSCAVIISLHEQSPDIAMGVNKSFEAKNGEADEFDIGAGDQGLMFGYKLLRCTILFSTKPLKIQKKFSLPLAKGIFLCYTIYNKIYLIKSNVVTGTMMLQQPAFRVRC